MEVLSIIFVHIAQEQKEGKWIPLPWEKEKKMYHIKGKKKKKPMKKKKPAMKKKKK